jgi:hypothetical protein
MGAYQLRQRNRQIYYYTSMAHKVSYKAKIALFTSLCRPPVKAYIDLTKRL